MEQFSAIIIDDEKNTRDVLKELLKQNCPEIFVCGMACSASEGRQLLYKFQVDIIFLDISMPKEDGFEFIASIPKDSFGIIFITAFHEFAIKALKANAIDYLLKPIDPNELKEAVARAIKLHVLRNTNQELQRIYKESLVNLQDNIKSNVRRPIMKITISEQFGFKIVNLCDLMYLLAESNYTTLILKGGGRIVATKTLGEFEKIIDNPFFYRIHKSVIINLDYLSGYSNVEGNFAELKDGTRLSISRRKVPEFRIWIRKYSAPIE
jgi:two-component system, LytTR family, response regulator